MTAYITLPGINGSGRDHWQTLWEAADPSFTRFQPEDWDQPSLIDWSSALDRAVAAAAEPPVLVAHSLACLLVAHWAVRTDTRRIAGAFLVSVPDPKGPEFPTTAARSFADADLPNVPLPFPTLIIASTDDPYGTVVHARHCAKTWNTGLIITGAYGHLNEASGLGNWPLGTMLLQAFDAGLWKSGSFETQLPGVSSQIARNS